MSIERKFYAFMARRKPRPPDWKDVPDWVKEFAEFVERTERLSVASRNDETPALIAEKRAPLVGS